MNTNAATTSPISHLLAADEIVVWRGQAPSGIRFRKADAFLIPFSLFWGGFAFLWEGSALSSHAPHLFGIWGIPFVLVGAYFIFGRFLVDAYFRRRTSYALTDRAAYVARSDVFPAVRRFAGSALDAVSLEPGRNGIGTIRFVPAATMAAMRGGWSIWNASTLDAFEAIPDATDVYQKVTSMQRR